ncbi:MAG: hypothetical protein DCC67_21015 [Planctomycetota bacterium]|nr:MAG: hypothetical protein DCC67_21015 [Planctomycetota bacterium]
MKTAWAAAVALVCIGPPTARGAFPPVALQPVSQGQIVSPVGISNAADGSNRLFVLDQRGKIHVIQNGSLLPAPLLDLSSKLVEERPNFDERGLLGLAFHPNFGQAGAPGADKFYVFYSAPSPLANPTDPVNPINVRSTIAEYAVTSVGANTADVNSERILLAFDKPQFNHNGGNLSFGPDGMLYISTGDGGGAGDDDAGHTGGSGNTPGALGNGQDRTNLLGKILRIDVNGNNGPGGQYGIPADNPLVGAGGGVREEIYAYGFRNPWRVTFDDGPGGTGRLIAADVGQNLVEEINIVEKGGNYGWRIKEGTFPFDPTVSPTPAVPLVDPVAQYAHPGAGNGLQEFGISITGGEVYRGAQFPALQGKYIFGDFSTAFSPANGVLLGMEETSPGAFSLSQLTVVGGNPIGQYITAFGRDETGEVYVAAKTALAASGLGPGGEPGTSMLTIAATTLLLRRASRVVSGTRRRYHESA